MIHENTEINLYLIRHAESEMNTKPELIGGQSKDTPLTQKGREQALKLGKIFADDGLSFDRVFSSPFMRALHTSELVTGALGYPPEKIIQVPALEELSQGDWEGLYRDEVYSDEVFSRINTKGMFFTPKNGEYQRSAQRRIGAWFDNDIIFNPDYLDKKSVLAAFSHAATIKCFLQDVLNFDPAFIYKLSFGNTGYCRLLFNKKGLFIPKLITHP